ncbi:MAG: hypothetical protein JXR96_06380 [Deltaproteobacteria bacterium]|nr:hypothetical protein [Deltaproteobacteria bacterium]
MPSVTARGLTAKVIRGLKLMAKRNGRSMEAEIRVILEEAAMERAVLLDRIEEELDRQPRSTTRVEVDRWLRETREQSR